MRAWKGVAGKAAIDENRRRLAEKLLSQYQTALAEVAGNPLYKAVVAYVIWVVEKSGMEDRVDFTNQVVRAAFANPEPEPVPL